MLKIVGIAGMMALATSAMATVYTLTDGNSTAHVETAGSAGMYDWQVDGVNQLAQQWFWYRVGTTSGEQAIGNLTLDTAGTVQLDASTLKLKYTGQGFTIQITYALTGGSLGSHTSDIAESIRIQNTGTSTLDFHFFQYSDFDLNGTAGNDTGIRTNPNSIRQSDPLAGVNISETVITPSPTFYQIDTFPNLLNALNDGTPTTLANTPGIGTSVGPADVTWAFQWDFSIAGGGTAIISKDKRLDSVPDAGSTVALLGMALTGLALAGRRFSRK